MIKNEVHYPLLGQLLHERYQIIQVLSSGAFGQTYLAQDIAQENKPKCVVKHHRLLYNYPDLLKTSRRILLTEAEHLKTLGSHDQIPQLLACFEENKWLCLVQELIEGRTLDNELPLKKQDPLWSEEQVMHLLQDLLSVLDFVHSHGVIHCDIKPNNIIQRSGDDKYILIDFGAAQTPYQHNNGNVSGQKISNVQALGYLAPEQLTGRAYGSSDLYALGMIAIQALTGLEPRQLPVNWETGELDWQELLAQKVFSAQISEELLVVLMKMVAAEPSQRYQSAIEVQKALEQKLAPQAAQIAVFEQIKQSLSQEEEETPAVEKLVLSPVDEKNTSERPDIVEFGAEIFEVAINQLAKIPLIITGMGVGMAATNVLAIALGAYSLVNTMAAMPELDRLREANQQYNDGNLFEALSIAESIPDDSPVFEEFSRVDLVKRWQKQWETAEAQFTTTKKVYEQKQWFEVLAQGQKIPDIDYWQDQAKPMLKQAYDKTEGMAKRLLAKAFMEARKRNFTAALAHLEAIHPRTRIGATIEPKLREYRQKEQVRATFLLQQAYDSAQERQFKQAIGYLEQIPPNTNASKMVPVKVAEYQQKQRIRDAYERNLRLANQNKVIRTMQLDPGSQLQEITPEPGLFKSLQWY